KGFSTDDMAASGMLIAGDDIPEPYDRFRNRVMFPILDLKGRVIAFGGRALDKGRVVVVEGYMDVLALAEAGFVETVAPLGTALTEDQLKLLWRFAPE